MKYWVLAGLGVIALLVVFGIAVSVGVSSGGSSEPTVIIELTRTASPSASPAITPPVTCGEAQSDDCEKQATTAAFAAYADAYHPSPNSIGIVSSEYVEWPDSCLGVSTPGVACAQVITPGFRIVVRGDASLPEVEYHTDLQGHAVPFATMTLSPTPSP